MRDDQAENADDGRAVCSTPGAIPDEFAVLPSEPIDADDTGRRQVHMARRDVETQVVNR
jgi:hypothetical protein